LQPHLESPLKLYESLRTALRTQPNSFVHRFLTLGGLNTLLQALSHDDDSSDDTSTSTSHPAVISCIKSLMNNSGGRTAVLNSPTAINVLAQSLAGDDIRAKIDVLEILGAVCLVPGGHRRVLESISYLQSFARERARFQVFLFHP
jgi:dishevelled associated activator of morphogenesis